LSNTIWNLASHLKDTISFLFTLSVTSFVNPLYHVISLTAPIVIMYVLPITIFKFLNVRWSIDIIVGTHRYWFRSNEVYTQRVRMCYEICWSVCMKHLKWFYAWKNGIIRLNRPIFCCNFMQYWYIPDSRELFLLTPLYNRAMLNYKREIHGKYWFGFTCI
jgi:hypothetical protein